MDARRSSAAGAESHRAQPGRRHVDDHELVKKSDVTRQGSHATRSPRSENVRNRLLDIAERLFAESGIDAVSLNSVGRLADQRNGSVVQYHFGSKTGLIEAILERRMERMNARRLELLRQVRPAPRAEALRRLAEAMVLPIAEHLESDAGSNYIRFVAQITFSAQSSVFGMVRGRYDTAVREIAVLAQEILSDVPPEILRNRLALVTNLILFGFGEREKLRRAGRHTGVARLHTDLFIRELVCMIVGALSAPVAD